MSVNSEEKAKNSVVASAILRRNKLIYFVLNLALIIPYVVKHYSHWGLAIAVGIMLWAFFVIVVKPSVDTPASKDLPALLFFDVCVVLGMVYERLYDSFDSEFILLEKVVENFNEQCLYLLLTGIAVSVFTSNKQSMVWLKCAGKIAAGAAIIMQLWSNGEVLEPSYVDGGEAFLIYCLLWGIVWTIACVLACYAHPESSKNAKRLGTVLLLAWYVLNVTEKPIVDDLVLYIKPFLIALPQNVFAWWKVILSAIVLFGCAVVAYDYDNDRMTVDSIVLAFIASAVVLIKVLLENYFSYNWIIFIVFVVSSMKCLQNELRQSKTLRLTSQVYLLVQFISVLISIKLIKNGLWINAVVICLYTLVFYTTYGKTKTEKSRLRHWLLVLSAPAVYAAAYVWQKCFALDTIIMILLTYVVFAGVIIILSWPHPNNRIVPPGFKMLPCLFIVLFCLISMSRYGAKVDIEFNNDTDNAIVAIEARGKENQIKSVVYYWSDNKGEIIGSERTMSVEGSNISVKGEKLTVIVTDINGVITTETEWYPNWLLSR